MKPQLLLDLPTLGFVVSTRAALGAGVGLLAADRLSPGQRRALGAGLLAAGMLTTIPAAITLRRAMRRARAQRLSSPPELPPVARVEQDDRLRGLSRFPRKGDDELAG